MKRTVDDDTREIIQSFIIEGHERLDDAEIQLGKLGTVDDKEVLNAVFRLFHSVKGSAGFLEFDRIKNLTHEAEALLEVFIREGIAYTQESLDVVYATVDILRALINLVERDYTDADCGDVVDVQVLAIKKLVDELHDESAMAGPAAPPTEKVEPASFKADTAPKASASSQEADGSEGNSIALNELVTRDMAERFVAESADLVERVERDVLDLEGSLNKVEVVHSMFRAIHTVKGNAGFFGYAALEKRCMELEHILDGARKKETILNDAFVNSVLARIDTLRVLLSSVSYVETELPEALSPEPIRDEKTHPKMILKPIPPGSYKPLGEILVNMGAVDEDSVRVALERQERPVGQLLVEAGVTSPEDVEKALEIQRTLGSERSPVEEIRRREIRVDTAKLDKLFDLVGELITAESMVANSSDLVGLKLDHFSKSFSALTKISREIQETAMMIRMIPLESLFHKMLRLVRDLSRKFAKPVELKISGEDTEMDKNVIEQISDPLVHILRNAVDHGIEAVDRRRGEGKPEIGTISLNARYEGSEIWISVKDDGVGLNRDRILSIATEKGLVKGDPATLSDKDIWAFIFEPGFSTASIVSEVSGRGVGMDVVKRNLEKIRGRVDVRTEAGKGTEFILQIPLTMAIIDGITVRVGKSFYSVPLADILEFFKVRPDQITPAEHGQETVNMRGTVMPLLKLAEIFKIPDASLDPSEGTILVVQSGANRACLLIDEVVGNQQIVIKSLSEYIGKVEGLSGCSILGDGTVSFIIDTGRLIGLRLE